MLRPTLQRILRLDELVGRFDEIAQYLRENAQESSSPLAGGPLAIPQGSKGKIEKARQKLLTEASELDNRLSKALDQNNWSMWARLIILLLLAAAFVFAVAFTVVRQAWIEGSLGGTASLGAITWVFGSLKRLQDERLQLHLRVARQRPRIQVCRTLTCLEAVAAEIARDLQFLQTTGGAA